VTSDPASEMEVKPCARSGHSLVVVGRKAIVFGGCADSDQAPGAFYWRVSGPVSLQHMNNNIKVLIATAYLFPLCFPTVLLNDVHYMDLNDPSRPTWFKMEVNTENGLGPPARWRHTGTCISDGQMLVWGGIGEKSRYNDTHVLNVEEEVAFWEGEQPDGIPPSPRSYHTATPVGRRIYFFGGYGGDGQRREVIACTYTLGVRQAEGL